MATKVKGDKIKEGSIPLESLSEETKSKLGVQNFLNDENVPGGILGMPFGYKGGSLCTYEYNGTVGDFNAGKIKYYYYGTLVVSFTYTNRIEDIIDVEIESIKGLENKIEVNDSLFIYVDNSNNLHVVSTMKQDKSTFYFKAYEYRDKLPSKFIDAPTPDWNAKENEPGYIENKPFYTEGDIRQIDVNGEYSILIGEFNIGDRIDVSWDLDYYDTEEVFHGSASFVIQEEGEEPTQYYEGDNFYIRGGKSFEMYAYGADDPLYGKVTVMVNGEIKTLEEKYIPNTVLKTTPQTLTDTDKNQALANLGIDPVVWKYMCNPIILRDGLGIPLELVDENKVTFKYKIPGIYKLEINDDNHIDYYIYNCTHYYEDDGLYARVGSEQNYQINIIKNTEWDPELSENSKYKVIVYNDI